MIYTTLNEIQSFAQRRDRWEKLLAYLGKTEADDEPLPLVTVLDSNGLEDTIWCLRVCPDMAAEFARWCVARVDGADDRAAYWADRADHWADRADHCANLVAEASCWAARCGPAAESAEASKWAAYGAVRATGATERQAQADKLRELLT